MGSKKQSGPVNSFTSPMMFDAVSNTVVSCRVKETDTDAWLTTLLGSKITTDPREKVFFTQRIVESTTRSGIEHGTIKQSEAFLDGIAYDLVKKGIAPKAMNLFELILHMSQWQEGGIERGASLARKVAYAWALDAMTVVPATSKP